MQLVPEQSASLDGSKPLGMDVKHVVLNKFFSSDDPRFLDVCDTMHALIRERGPSEQIKSAERERFKDNQRSRDLISERVKNIRKPKRGTLSWVFDTNHPSKSGLEGFQQWLLSDDFYIFWIYGKAGSGKSTLMKAVWTWLADEHEARQVSAPHLVLKHSFWLLGEPLQKNYKGFLCGLVYQMAWHSNAMLDILLEDRKAASDITIWEEDDLEQLIEQLLYQLKRAPRKCMLIDGLDEIENADEKDLVETYLHRLSEAGRMKVRVSSRHEDRSRMTEADMAKALLHTELNLLRTGGRHIHKGVFPGLTNFVQDCYNDCSTLTKSDISKMIEYIVHFCQELQGSNMQLDGYLLRENETVSHMLSEYLRRPDNSSSEPALDIAGLSLAKGIPCFFDAHMVKYLSPHPTSGLRFTRRYKATY